MEREMRSALLLFCRFCSLAVSVALALSFSYLSQQEDVVRQQWDESSRVIYHHYIDLALTGVVWNRIELD